MRRSHTRRTRTPRGLLGIVLTYQRPGFASILALRTSHFTLRTPTHTSCSPELVALPPENNNCGPSESRSGLIHVMWPSTNASLWRQQFSFSFGQKCFGGRAAIVSREENLASLSVGQAGAWMRSRSSSSQLRVNYSCGQGERSTS